LFSSSRALTAILVFASRAANISCCRNTMGCRREFLKSKHTKQPQISLKFEHHNHRPSLCVSIKERAIFLKKKKKKNLRFFPCFFDRAKLFQLFSCNQHHVCARLVSLTLGCFRSLFRCFAGSFSGRFARRSRSSFSCRHLFEQAPLQPK
jgi:hypothetical protein